MVSRDAGVETLVAAHDPLHNNNARPSPSFGKFRKAGPMMIYTPQLRKAFKDD